MTKKLLKLDLGCGANPINGYLGIDIGYKKPNIIQSDVFSYLRKTKKNSVSHIYSRHYLEHETSENIIKLMKEIDRVLIKQGEMIFIVPHFSNPYYYSDPTHKTPWGVHSFSYFAEKHCLKRKVPNYIQIKGWELQDVSVRFISFFNFSFFGFKLPTLATILNLVINIHPFITEAFERYLSFIFSIYEVKSKIKKNS
jgi:predicted SAM-dependent methyltransferase